MIMGPFLTKALLLLLSILGIMQAHLAQAQTCLMIYQMADNNLEKFLREDYEELTNSPAIQSGNLKTWIYFDALNQANGEPLPNTLDANGNDLATTATAFTGSRYVTYDSAAGKMKVAVEFDGEQNSDLPDTIQRFLEYSLSDCLANGYTSTIVVFASHGGGWAGFGGDENMRRRGRHLLQSNVGVAGAVRAALDSTEGAPAQLEVLGFDACLMQSVEAADDYMGIAQYILASEAVEPGHGWKYDVLSNAGSALDLSKEVVQSFVDETQGGSQFHQSPKILSVVDTRSFNDFLASYEDFASEALAALQDGDASLHAYISRARASSISFEGVADVDGTKTPSALDIGSFLRELDTLCDPGGTLGPSLQATKAAYDAMFIKRGVGPGTAAGTGMHITWPDVAEYQKETLLWDSILFTNENYVTAIAPNHVAFLKYFLSSTGGGTGEQSVCGFTALVPASDVTGLIVSESAKEDEFGNFVIEAQISLDASEVMVEYGFNLTTAFQNFVDESGIEPSDQNFLYLLAGNVVGTYAGSSYSATWDQQFYFLRIVSEEQSFEALYAYDEGDGSMRVPAIYFPEGSQRNVSDFEALNYFLYNEDPRFQREWTEKGARYSFLQFSENQTTGEVNDQLTLFVSTDDRGFAEKPASEGGLLLPLVFTRGAILYEGKTVNITTVPGGFHRTILSWGQSIQFQFTKIPAEKIWSYIPEADAVMAGIKAYKVSDPLAAPESRVYNVKDRPESAAGDPESSGLARFDRRHQSLLISVLGIFGALVC